MTERMSDEDFATALEIADRVFTESDKAWFALLKAERTALEASESETDYLMETLVQQEKVLDTFVSLLNESLDDDGCDILFDERLADARQEMERLADWRTRDLLCLERRKRYEAAESQLAKLREGLEGLVKKWNRGTTDQDCLYDKGLYYCADEIKSLLTQTAPSVNSADGINAGENSGGGE